ncbi:MAG: Crp/Fnr family transcriptional regulator [Candidatus Omnitrophota bacterium]|jgi:CRP-like cAMP-binding protein|nr:MAG: Crp/Fnr family transcriptional regulator [Candidatus Omnitrophota bacterium]
MVESPFGDLAKEAIKAKKGAVLMRQGEIGRCAYFVVQGRLLVERETDGESIVLGEIGPRDIVGELAILDDAPRSATVVVIEDSVLIQLDKVRIKTIIRRSPAIAEVIMKLICHKLRQSHDLLRKTTDLCNPDYWRKICATLRLCANGTKGPDELFFTFLENIQLLTGASIPRLREILVRLEETQVIECEGRTIHRVDQERLQIFLVNCKEEFANEEIQHLTPARLYQAAQLLLSNCSETTDEKSWIEAPKQLLVELLLSAHFWDTLRPSLQQNRVEKVLQHLIASQIILPKPSSPDMMKVYPYLLGTVAAPREEIAIYNLMKSKFFKPTALD